MRVGITVRRGFREGVVSVQLAGSCEGCASSTATLQDGVERMLQYYVPEVEKVVAVEGQEKRASDVAFEALEAKLSGNGSASDPRSRV